ncbi:MAG: C-terminal processing protease CtpA/Prc [Bacteriovoracaceae bacterium]|jgi:C-terminal processing protease CtpA/Prc
MPFNFIIIFLFLTSCSSTTSISDKPKLPKIISKESALEDLDYLERELQRRWSYVDLNNVNLSKLIDLAQEEVSTSKADLISEKEFSIIVQKLISKFSDGHANVSGWKRKIDKGYLPFFIEYSKEGYLAIKTNREVFNEEFPFITRIDGKSIEYWRNIAGALVSKGSRNLRLGRTIRLLRYIQFLRNEAGLPKIDSVKITLKGKNGERKFSYPIAQDRHYYGEWPQKKSHIIDRNKSRIGYLRISGMSGKQKKIDKIENHLKNYLSTDGLIIDVRGNSGGSRDILRRIMPYFLKDGESVVVNVAAFKKDERVKAGDLKDRFLYTANDPSWSAGEQKEILRVAKNFNPEWKISNKEFSEWHFMVITGNVKYYDKPIIVLTDKNCFSATDIFLGALKKLRNVKLIGESSSGGSARSRRFNLPNSNLRIKAATMASFQTNGKLYDGNGIAPHISLTPEAGFFIGISDKTLEAAVMEILKN